MPYNFRAPRLVQLADMDRDPAPNARSVLRLNVGPEYRGLSFMCSDATDARTKAELLADIDEVTMRLGTTTVMQLTAAQLVMFAEYYSGGSVSPADNGEFPIFFAREWMQLGGNADIKGPALGTADLKNASIEIKWSATCGTTQVSVFGILSPRPAVLGIHTSFARHQVSFASTGRQVISDIQNEGIGKQLIAIHIPATPTLVEIKVDLQDFWEIDPAILTSQQKRAIPARTPQTDWTHLDFCLDGSFGGALPMNFGAFELALTWDSAPNSYDLVLEYLEIPPAAQPAVAKNI